MVSLRSALSFQLLVTAGIVLAGAYVSDTYAQSGRESYVVQSGENLWDISQRLLGSPEKYKLFVTLNPWLADPDSVLAGHTLYYRAEWKDFTRRQIKNARIAWLRSDAAIRLEQSFAESGIDDSRQTRSSAEPEPAGTRLLEITPDIKELKVEAQAVAFAETPALETTVSVRTVMKEISATPPAPVEAEARAEIVQKAVEANPEDKKLKSYLVTAQAIAGKEDAAQDTIEKMIEKSPEDAGVHAEASRFFATAAGRHNFDRALAEIHRAQELDPSNNSYLIEELSMARKAGLKEQAREVARRLTNRMPAFAAHPVVRQVLDEKPDEKHDEN